MDFKELIMQQRIVECCPDLLYTVEGKYFLTLYVKNIGKHNLYNFRICRTKLTPRITWEREPYVMMKEACIGSCDTKFYDKSVLTVGACYSYNINFPEIEYNLNDIVTSEFEVKCQDAFGTNYTQKLTVTVSLKEDKGLIEKNILDVKCDKPTVEQKENIT